MINEETVPARRVASRLAAPLSASNRKHNAKAAEQQRTSATLETGDLRTLRAAARNHREPAVTSRQSEYTRT